jgi:SAM-dependent methyltransferase
MALCIETYLKKKRHYDVLDFGSHSGTEGAWTHRDQLAAYNVTYTGVDIMPGPNVDVVMAKPYRLPFKSNSFDLIVSGATFEHIPFLFTSFLEISRVLRPTGLIFFVAPSRGHAHFNPDPWRFYPDSMRSLAAHSRMHLKEAHTDFPPRIPDSERHDYQQIDTTNAYWGDTVGVFQKPKHYSKTIAVIREINVWWSNRVGDLGHVPRPKPLPGRDQVAR